MSEDKKAKTSMIDKFGSISNKKMSLIASVGMGTLLIVPAVISIYGLIVKHIDRIHTKHMLLIQSIVFPLICVIAFALYILNVCKIKKENQSLKKILRRNPLIIIFAIAALWMIISQIYNGIGYALDGFMILTIGETFDTELAYFIFILFAATQVTNEYHKRILLRIHMVTSVCVIITGFLLWNYRFEVGDTYYIEDVGFCSIFWNINHYGYYLAVTVSLAAAAFVNEKKIFWKIFSGLIFLANSVALSLADSIGPWIGGFLGVIFVIVAYIIIEKKVNWQSLLLIPAFLVCLYVPGHLAGTFDESWSSLGNDIEKVVNEGSEAKAGNGRWANWKGCMTAIGENPVFGLGFECIYRNGLKGVDNARPHNEFIQYALFFGIPMAAMYIIGCFGVFIRALKQKKKLDGASIAGLSAAFGYLVSSFFGLTVFSTAYFLFVFLGIGYVHTVDE